MRFLVLISVMANLEMMVVFALMRPQIVIEYLRNVNGDLESLLNRGEFVLTWWVGWGRLLGLGGDKLAWTCRCCRTQ